MAGFQHRIVCASAFLVAAMVVAGPIHDAHERTVPELVQSIIWHVEEDKPIYDLVSKAVKRGGAVIVEAAKHLNPESPKRNRVLVDLIHGAGEIRRFHPELMRLYDPAAYRLYYMEAGRADLRRIGAALEWKEWPDNLASAIVRAAPDAAREWLRAEAAKADPDHHKVRQLLDAWGWWIQAERERVEYRPHLVKLAAAVTSSKGFNSSVETRLELLEFAARLGDVTTLDFVTGALKEKDVRLRLAAVSGLAAIGTDAARRSLIATVSAETAPTSLATMIIATRAWPEDRDMGYLLLNLFKNTQDPLIRRYVLYVTADSAWPQRDEIIRRALNSENTAVLDTTMQVISGKAPASVADRVLAIAGRQTKGGPNIANALGMIGDERGVKHLKRWFEGEKNPGMRITINLALEKIGGTAAAELLGEMMGSETDITVMKQIIGAAGRMHIVAAYPHFKSIARDTDETFGVRLEAIGAMAKCGGPKADVDMAALDRAAEELFVGDKVGRARIEQVRGVICVARYLQGNKDVAGTMTDRFKSGSPLTQMIMLMMLKEAGIDHPIIRSGLASNDFSVMIAGIYAAGAPSLAPRYHGELKAARALPFIQALIDVGQSSLGLGYVLDSAIAEGAPKR